MWNIWRHFKNATFSALCPAIANVIVFYYICSLQSRHKQELESSVQFWNVVFPQRHVMRLIFLVLFQEIPTGSHSTWGTLSLNTPFSIAPSSILFTSSNCVQEQTCLPQCSLLPSNLQVIKPVMGACIWEQANESKLFIQMQLFIYRAGSPFNTHHSAEVNQGLETSLSGLSTTLRRPWLKSPLVGYVGITGFLKWDWAAATLLLFVPAQPDLPFQCIVTM